VFPSCRKRSAPLRSNDCGTERSGTGNGEIMIEKSRYLGMSTNLFWETMNGAERSGSEIDIY